MVVVLTVIIFGGTTARMLEIMGIRTGVVEELDSDDEFDIETVTNGTYYKRAGTALGHTPLREDFNLSLGKVSGRQNGNGVIYDGGYSSSSSGRSPIDRPTGTKRTSSVHSALEGEQLDQSLLDESITPPEDNFSDSDLPPAAPRRSSNRRPSPPPADRSSPYPTSGSAHTTEPHMTATGAIRDFFHTTDDSAAWFKKLDEAVIKPTLLLDQSSKGGGGV